MSVAPSSAPSDNEDIFDTSPNALSILESFWDEADQNWNFVFGRTNAAFQKVFWGGKNLHVGRDFREVRGRDHAEALAILRQVRETGEPTEGEVFIAEVERWFFVSVHRARSGNLYLIHNEITDKEHLRKQAHQEQARYQRLFEMGAVKLVVSATSARVLDANAQALAFYGWSREQLRSRSWGEFTSLPLECILHTLDRNQRPEAVFFTEQTRRDGKNVAVEIHASRILVEDEWVLLLIVFDGFASHQQRLAGASEPDEALAALATFRRRHVHEFPFIDELLAPLLPIGRLRRFRRGQNFIAAGEPSTYSGLSANGVFRTYLIDQRGNEVTLGFTRPGEFVASYTALVAGTRSQVFLEALTDCEVFVLDAKDLFQQMQADPRWYALCYRIQQWDISQREQREIALLSEPLRARYAKFVDDHRDLLGLIHNYQIASYLGVTPETLSRVCRPKRPKTPVS